MLPLILYDIPSKLPGTTWSPNPGKPRLVLGYKNLPYETVWIEYPDIAPRLKELGASINKLSDGREQYTLPVLSDPNTGALITDSWAIAEYLDRTYPERPIFPPGSNGLINAFESAIRAKEGNAFKFNILRSSQVLNERSLGYFLSTREALFGDKVDNWSPEGPVRDAHLKIMEDMYFGSVKTWYDGTEGKWVIGNTFSYADIIFAARVIWMKKIYRDDEWSRIASLDGGRWEKYLSDVKKECNLV